MAKKVYKGHNMKQSKTCMQFNCRFVFMPKRKYALVHWTLYKVHALMLRLFWIRGPLMEPILVIDNIKYKQWHEVTQANHYDQRHMSIEQCHF